VSLDAFLDQPDAVSVRLEAGDDVRRLAPLLDRIRLIEVDFPKFRDGRGFSSARDPARDGLHRRDQGDRRRAGRPGVLHAPLRLRQLRARRAVQP
jgi:uncharacterized protein (DUF934 family)